MLNGSPPPARTAGPDTGRLATARGCVRDTLGAVRNLEKLLMSIRVGPKAIASVIPDVHESCEPLKAAFAVLLEAVRVRLPEVAQAMDEYVSPRIDELERALRRGRRVAMNAKERLALERVLTRVVSELDEARSQVELLSDAVGGSFTRVAVLELARETFKSGECRDGGPPRPVNARLECRQDGEVLANPRVAVWLIAAAIRLVASRQSGTTLTVATERRSDGALAVTVTPGPTGGESVEVLTPGDAGPLLPCAQAAANAIGARFELGDETSQAAVVWATPPTEK
jgi:hypothetical protein